MTTTSKPSASEKKGLTPYDYLQALHSQSACNLSGIVHSFSEVISRIWDEAQARGHGTDWVNEHPICRLYAEQIAWLTRKTDYSRAHDACQVEASRLSDA